MSATHDLAEHHHDANGTDVFGFWMYILTDCILFASLFATFIVMHKPGAFGPSLKSIIELPYVFIETMCLLGSNFTFCLAMLSFYREKKLGAKFWLILTFILGAGFVGMEVNEFINLCHEGFCPQTSGLASAFFTLVGTHGLHVSFGLLWIFVMIVQLFVFPINEHTERRLIMLGIFWNFLDIIWIFVFSIVYLTGAL
jgi:cytochrome o ubiquinol oxidase subunit 3